MGSQMPELGSKISVISKADIRYEGRLYQVDPQECTIGLANVRSFGTEDRETHYPVPAQNQIYEYILFRGSDIKDIRVINSTPIHQDPAIVQLVPPATSGFQSQVMGGFSYGGGGLGGLQRPLIQPQQQQQPSELGPVTSDPQDKDPVSVSDLMGGGVSRSTTPSLTRKSPTMDQSTQVTSSPPHPRPIQPPPRDRFVGGRREPQSQPPNDNNRSNFYERRPHNLRRDNNYDNRNNQMHNRQGPRASQEQQLGGWVHRGPQQNRPRGMGRPRGATPNRAGAPTPRKKNLLKFESEYDFDKANSEFEELRNKLTKLKVSGETENVVEAEKKEDSGNETGAGEAEHEDEVFYDKQKSFFDTISCEAVERSKGRSQRTDWRAERKLNSETFGVSSARRGMYRGGRGYYGGQRGYGYRAPPRPQDPPPPANPTL